MIAEKGIAINSMIIKRLLLYPLFFILMNGALF